jgi:hypothetical protein
MTKEAYWSVFLRTDKPENFDKLLEYPDYDAALERVKKKKEAK